MKAEDAHNELIKKAEALYESAIQEIKGKIEEGYDRHLFNKAKSSTTSKYVKNKLEKDGYEVEEIDKWDGENRLYIKWQMVMVQRIFDFAKFITNWGPEGLPRDENERAVLAVELIYAANEAGIASERIWVGGTVTPVNIQQPQLILNSAYMVMLERYGMYSVISDPRDEQLTAIAQRQTPGYRSVDSRHHGRQNRRYSEPYQRNAGLRQNLQRHPRQNPVFGFMVGNLSFFVLSCLTESQSPFLGDFFSVLFGIHIHLKCINCLLCQPLHPDKNCKKRKMIQ